MYTKVSPYFTEAQRVGTKFEGPSLRQKKVFVHLLDLTLLIPGKWVYEVLISSQGLMQIGWCTINCRFNQEVHTEEGAPPRETISYHGPSSSGFWQPPDLLRTLTWTFLWRRNVSHSTPGHPRVESLIFPHKRQPPSLEPGGSKVGDL